MNGYQRLVETTLREATYKPNRTGVDTLSQFSHHYEVDLQDGFPLLTTKDMSGFRWNSLISEIKWYLDGEAHIRNLTEETGIWDDWADDHMLDTAYGRFWRRYPLPEHEIQGEAWMDADSEYANDGGETFDQIEYVVDQLRENPSSRRLVISAWHPANAAASSLPPCHFTYVLNVQGGELNCHLTQRSGDIGLGVPFNIACYSILTKLFAQMVDGLTASTFSHTVVDAHVYCGTSERGAWYGENIEEIQSRLPPATREPHKHAEAYKNLREWIIAEAPPEAEEDEKLDHVPGLLEQLTRKPKERPTLELADHATVNNFSPEDVTLSEYDSHSGIVFAVAE